MQLKLSVILLIPVVIFAEFSFGQHEHHMDSTNHEGKNIEMSHAFSLNLPMSRNGSGTSWLPDSAVMYGHGVHIKNWMLMVHGNIFIRYNKQDITNAGSRGGEKIDAPNWLMLMAQRKAGKRGLFSFGSMFSLDPLTVGSEGYPLLFQTGETHNGKRLVDNQHPHDLFSELAIAYTHMVSKKIDITAYLGYPGEPSIGPVTFMHRPSALNNPDAPLGHHWQDATHITFGTATAGIRLGRIKLEGSLFTGREPDENRYNFDEPRFDSYSYRLLVNPDAQLAFQISRAFLKSPEAIEPDEDITRTTASIIHHIPFGKPNHYLSTTFLWGQNSGHLVENSLLLESTLQLDKTAVYGRYEWVQKSASELDLQQFLNGHEPIFEIHAFTAGINRVILRKAGNNIAIGVQGSAFISDSWLKQIYGSNPLSAEIYLRLYPHLMHTHKH